MAEISMDGEKLGVNIANDFWADFAAEIPGWLWPIAAAVAISVVSTVLVPWMTVQRTKTIERREKERAERRDAAAALLKAAGDLYMEAERRNEERRSGNAYSIDLHRAAATILILTTDGRKEGRSFLEDLPVRILRDKGNFTLTLADVLSSWIPRGRFAVKDLPRLTRPATEERP